MKQDILFGLKILTPQLLFFSVFVFFPEIGSEQKVGTSTAIIMVQCIHVQLGENITIEVA